MPDSTIEAIDRVFDFLDKGVDAADHLLNRGKRTADLHRSRTRQEVIDVEATPRRAPKRGNGTTAVAHRPHFYIVEKTDPVSSRTIFVVTDGKAARTECANREFAEQLIRALEQMP